MKIFRKNLFTVFFFVLLIGLVSGTCPVLAGDFPSRTIRVEVPWGAGSNTDAIAMMVAPYLEEALGQRIVPVYKKGGGGIIGTAWAAKQPPDGYTILAEAPGPIVVKPYLKKVPYSYKDFEPIAMICVYPTVLVTQEGGRFKNFQDLLEQARKNPGKITYSTSGTFSMAHLTMEVVQKAAGIKLKHLPYEGGAKALAALLGGHVDLTGTELRGSIGQDGKTKVLVSTTKERLKKFPNVPTVKEKGYDIVSNVWIGFLAPKGTPREIINILEAGIKKVSQDEEFQKKLAAWGPALQFLTSTEFGNLIESQIDMFSGPIERLKN